MSQVVVVPAPDAEEGSSAEAATEAAEAISEVAEALTEAVEAITDDDDDDEEVPEWRIRHAEHAAMLAEHEARITMVESRLIEEEPEMEPEIEQQVEQVVPEPDVTPEQLEALEQADEQQANWWRRLGRWV